MKKMKKKWKKEDILLDGVVYLVLILLVIVTFYPMWHVLMASFSTSSYIAKEPGLLFWPKKFTLGAYEKVFSYPKLMGSFRNTFFLLIAGLPINIVLTLLCGYFMSCTGMLWKKPIVAMIMFTMFFSGGLIPGFLNIRSLGLYNSLWALILPGALSVYNAIICKTAIEAIPDSLKESAFMDGANDFQVIFRIIVPLMKPTLAVLLLYYGVAHWNSWFAASIYLKDERLMPVQNVIREILLKNVALATGTGDYYDSFAETIKYAAIVVTTVPILCIYPFLQKYFTKGVMIGAVKG